LGNIITFYLGTYMYTYTVFNPAQSDYIFSLYWLS